MKNFVKNLFKKWIKMSGYRPVVVPELRDAHSLIRKSSATIAKHRDNLPESRSDAQERFETWKNSLDARVFAKRKFNLNIAIAIWSTLFIVCATGLILTPEFVTALQFALAAAFALLTWSLYVYKRLLLKFEVSVLKF